MAKTSITGNRPSEFKKEVKPGIVRKWREILNRDISLLKIDKRIKSVKIGDRYIDGTMKTKNNRTIYLRYALPLLEEMHRRTLPRIPTPNIKARNQRAEDSIDVLREFSDTLMNTVHSRVLQVAEEAQWDDTRAGVGFVRAGWETVTKKRDPELPTDPVQIQSEIDAATEESLNPLAAAIAEDDLHELHAILHNRVLVTMVPFTEEYWALQNHTIAHDAASVEVRSERIRLHRVPWYLFVYDTDVIWEERGYEAEMKSRKVQDLLDQGYKNINRTNTPPEEKSGESALPFEQKTIRVWEIHDRLKGELIVIGRDGPLDGAPLFKGDWPFGEIEIYFPVIMRKALPEQTYGEATIQMLIPILDQLAAVDFYISRHVENHASAKIPMLDSDLSAQRTKQALNDPNSKYYPISDKMAAIGGLKHTPPPPIPQTLLDFRNTLLSELRRVTGSDAQDTGASNPHKVTAQESRHREGVRDERKTDRQEIMGKMLAWANSTFLAMYKKFGTLAVTIRTYGPEGVNYHRVVPDDIPSGIDIDFDIKGETEEAKANKIVAWQTYNQYLLTIAEFSPSDWTELRSAYGRALGINRPERFIARQGEPQPLQGGSNTQPVNTQPVNEQPQQSNDNIQFSDIQQTA